MSSLRPPGIDAIRSARQRLAGRVIRTPLVPLQAEEAGRKIYLKLENLQPTGSFKVRGAGNALLSAGPDALRDGVWTASAGNMGQALAWYARQLNVACSVIVPDDAPEVKVQAIRRFGAAIVRVPFPEYQSIQREGHCDRMKGLLVHPFADESVLAGNATIGLELLEDLPDVEVVLVPFGGGGLSCGIAAAIKEVRPDVRVEAVEVETATPLTTSLAAGHSTEVSYHSSFISGMGAPFVFPQMWPLASQFLDGSQVVSLADTADAIRLMSERHHVVAEGAGAVASAAALRTYSGKKVICIVSGGNIAAAHLSTILCGGIP